LFLERKRRLARSLVAFAVLLAGFGVHARQVRAEPAHLVVVEGTPDILEPPSPLPLAGKRVRLTPTADGGYTTAVLEGQAIPARGKLLRFPDRDAPPVHVPLVRPIALYGATYGDLYVHPHGAVTLGEPFADDVRASAADPGSLRSGLLSGPAVVAPLWNELLPGRPIPGGGVYVAQWNGATSVSWIGVPSARPADAPNTFGVVFRADGVIDIDYGPMSSTWGLVGIAPESSARVAVETADFAAATTVSPESAALAQYRDHPVLNEIALARRVYRQTPDRFEFMTVFTTVPVDGPHPVYSTTVKNTDQGIGLPTFDQSSLFGSDRLEHMIFMNDLALWSDDPAAPPRAPGYAFAESTLAVLAHETGHRWLSHLDRSVCSGDGHWSYFLESGASLMGGHRLRENPDGSFTSVAALESFSPLDLYLMGLLPAADVPPFFAVDDAHAFTDGQGRPISAPHPESKPDLGVTFRGVRRDESVGALVDRFGPRHPAAESGKSLRMAFVLVVPQGSHATPSELTKMERVRRAFGPYFRQAVHGHARMWTRVPPVAPTDEVPEDALLTAGVPRVIGARLRQATDGRKLVEIDFADYDGDLAALEVSTDVSADLPPARLEIDGENHGTRRGTITLVLRDLPADAAELRVSLVDELGQRSPVFAWPLMGDAAAIARESAPPGEAAERSAS
jgi:hypothetical protein